MTLQQGFAILGALYTIASTIQAILPPGKVKTVLATVVLDLNAFVKLFK